MLFGGRTMGGSSFPSCSWSSSRSYPRRSPSQIYSTVSQDITSIVIGTMSLVLVVLIFVAICDDANSFYFHDSVGFNNDKRSIFKLQVGLSGMGSSLQRDLKRIAEVAETYTSKGLSYVLRETALALLPHSDYCIYAYSSVDVKWGMYEGERRFNQLSLEERAKINVETLVDMNKMPSSYGQRASGFSSEYMVVTILVAAKGVHKLPSVKGSNDLKEALQKLATIPTAC